MLTPIDLYNEKCRTGIVTADTEQLRALQILQQVFFDLIVEHKRRSGLRRWLGCKRLVKGAYLWGGVGIGKTFIMDCFFNALSLKEKKRLHFHAFMRFVHEQLRAHQGEKNPLDTIAKEFARTTLLLCFDELLVNDITDAMILARLLKALFTNGVCLVMTSNTQPDQLYWRGLQRQQFLPAIDLIKDHTQVIHLATTQDYRLRLLKEAGVFYSPHNANAIEQMQCLFDSLSLGHEQLHKPLIILDRQIPLIKQAGDIAWFDFATLCSPPRSQLDYLALATRFRIIFLSNISLIRTNEHNTITLFIRLIDVLYDAKIKLVFSSAKPIPQIYEGGQMSAAYARTQSRLLEMQSEEYFRR